MGIIKLLKFFEKYVKTANIAQSNIDSKVCYIDYTSNLVVTTNNVARNKEYVKLPIIDKIRLIIDTNTTNIVKQLSHNKYFTKYVIVFDYKYLSKFNSLFKFSDIIINNYNKYFQFKKDYIDSIPMIPKNLNLSTPINILKESVRNFYEIRINNLNPLNYQNLYLLLSKTNDESDKVIIQSLINAGITRYIVLRGAKNTTRRNRRNKILCKSIHSSKTYTKSSLLQNKMDNINIRLFESMPDEQLFNSILADFKNTVNYPLIINLIPILVSRVKDELNKYFNNKNIHSFNNKNTNSHNLITDNIEFIGCENESDYVIRKHILLYNSLNCPTIYTNDSDLFMLLADINCYIRIKSPSLNVRIKPNVFWQWLTDQKNIYYDNIVALCCLMGNDYNHFKFLKFKIDTVEDIRELFKHHKNLYHLVYGHALKLCEKYSTEPHKLIDVINFIISLEIYKQADLIENEIHFIHTLNEKESNELINTNIEIRYRNIFTDNF